MERVKGRIGRCMKESGKCYEGYSFSQVKTSFNRPDTYGALKAKYFERGGKASSAFISKSLFSTEVMVIEGGRTLEWQVCVSRLPREMPKLLYIQLYYICNYYLYINLFQYTILYLFIFLF